MDALATALHVHRELVTEVQKLKEKVAGAEAKTEEVRKEVKHGKKDLGRVEREREGCRRYSM